MHHTDINHVFTTCLARLRSRNHTSLPSSAKDVVTFNQFVTCSKGHQWYMLSGRNNMLCRGGMNLAILIGAGAALLVALYVVLNATV